MQSLENLAGQLQLALHYVQEGDVCHVSTVFIRSSRLRLSSRFFEGKPVETAPQLVGLMFSLCGMAQSVASARACEQALGKPPDAATEQRRDFQLTVETLFEHLLRLSQDWNKALECKLPDPAELQRLFRFKRDVLQASEPQPVLAGIRQWIDQHLYPNIDNLVEQIHQNGWEQLGNTDLQPLPDLPVGWWRQRLTAGDAENFMAAPDVDGQACETSALTRQWDNPELQVWRRECGSGLLTRLRARVLDMEKCLEELNPPQSPFFKGGSKDTLSESVPPFEKGGAGGISFLQTARGLLTHRVLQQDGLIREYQIVAPTEWNFHPQGPLQKMLSTLHGKDEAGLTQQARMLITALDPCVDYQLKVIRDA